MIVLLKYFKLFFILHFQLLVDSHTAVILLSMTFCLLNVVCLRSKNVNLRTLHALVEAVRRKLIYVTTMMIVEIAVMKRTVVCYI